MGNFSRGGDRGGRDFGPKKFGGRSFGGGSRGFGGGRDRDDRGGDRPMFTATCSKCGKDAQLPFRPTGDRPVFCSNCFETEKGSSFGSNFSRPARNFDRPSFGARTSAPAGNPDQYKQQFEALNTKLDKIVRLLTAKDMDFSETSEVSEEKEPKQSLGSKSKPVVKAPAKPVKKAAAKKKK